MTGRDSACSGLRLGSSSFFQVAQLLDNGLDGARRESQRFDRVLAGRTPPCINLAPIAITRAALDESSALDRVPCAGQGLALGPLEPWTMPRNRSATH